MNSIGHAAALEADESTASAISWAAVLGGAFASASLAMILLAGGAGLGLLSVSPWSGTGIAASTFGIGAIIWLIVVQVASSGFGGYLAGRLRTRWSGLHGGEVYFRDTAHGFLSWAVGAVISAAILTSTISSLVGGVAQTGASAVTGIGSAAVQAGGQAAQGVSGSTPISYYVDTMFRADHATNTADSGQARAEIGQIVTTSLMNGQMSPDDRTYVARIIAAQTGLSQADAEQRVDQVVGQAKAAADKVAESTRAAADKARVTAAAISVWTFISMLIGAFSASLCATFGGRARDLV
ncbi:hypothetical protein SAMN07250955_103306 [Arboricoccus pini]|uniref:Transmembrane protein n=1 Tax=Arboricoccus pini TaxID=1963835 RepID=A0A212QUY2_9PROT|nr:hypothetical protein [Arboricoccus pini]SNB63315.1 hypothetical protein SAMN07250955_103306 [Arboricoccus pini]